jgi:hypothetical protein
LININITNDALGLIAQICKKNQWVNNVGEAIYLETKKEMICKFVRLCETSDEEL